MQINFNLKVAIGIIALAVLVLVVGAGSYFYIQKQIKTPLKLKAASQIFTVKKGERSRDIAARLQAENITRDFYFQFYLWQKGMTNHLQVGDYELSAQMTIPEIAEKIVNGRTVTFSVTIPEGYTLDQVTKKLNLQKDSLANYDISKLSYDFLKGQKGLEGYLFPDTYQFQKSNFSVDVAVKKFLDNFNSKLTDDLRLKISQQGKTIQEIIILASIVQAEAADASEMPIIAGIFYNRLAIGMALQSDATINYITGKNMRQALGVDTKINSPYNTYMRKGLPPGPINNPGLDAIKAAIYPIKTSYLYFLHPANGSGAVYSLTAEEHNRNREKYLR